MKTKLIGKNDDSILNIFMNRGINPNDIYNLNSSALLPSMLIKNMNEAIELVHKHFTSGSKGYIIIQQDPDADGYTSTALIYDYLVSCYPEQKDRIIILIQENKAHNIQIDIIKQILEQGNIIDFVIAPDCSSNEPETHKKLKNIGIDVLVLDHHDAEIYSPYAVMVNISLDDYPNKSLSGVGVCQKFAKAYDDAYGFDFAENYYDLVAVGMIGDMIEINTLESIYMIQVGMKEIKNTFLKALYKAKSFNLGDQVTPIGVAFYIVPLINAVTRVGLPEEKSLVLQAMITKEEIEVQSSKRGFKEGDTELLQEQAVRIMNNIKSRQKRLVDKAIKELSSQIEDNKLYENQIMILESSKDMPREFTGLIANKFMQQYKKPTLVGKLSSRKIEDQTIDFFSGSARGDDKSALPNLKTFENESGLFEYAEGHEPAHGFSFKLENKDKIVEYFNTELSDLVFEPIHKLDFDIDFKEVSKDNILEIARYATFWSRGLEEPTFCLRNVPVNADNVEVAGSFDNHRISFKSGFLDFIKFFDVSDEDARKLVSNQVSKVDVVGKVKLSNYKGEQKIQVFMDEFEVKSGQKYYF